MKVITFSDRDSVVFLAEKSQIFFHDGRPVLLRKPGQAEDWIRAQIEHNGELNRRINKYCEHLHASAIRYKPQEWLDEYVEAL